MPVPCPHPALLSVVPALAPSVGGGTEGLLFLSPACPVVFSTQLVPLVVQTAGLFASWCKLGLQLSALTLRVGSWRGLGCLGWGALSSAVMASDGPPFSCFFSLFLQICKCLGVAAPALGSPALPCLWFLPPPVPIHHSHFSLPQGVLNFVQYKFSHLPPKERQTMYELSKMFLLCLNYWKLETPSQFRQRSQNDDVATYKVNYTR